MKDFYRFMAGVIITFIIAHSIFYSYERMYGRIIPTFITIQSDCPEPIPALTKENVLREIVKQDIKEPLIVLRQVLWETGHLKCTNCSLDYSNLFGFTSDKMIKFDNWIESIKFYKEWQSKYNGGDYYEFMKKYWGAPEMDKYCESLKQIKI